MKARQLLLSLFALLTASTAWADVEINETTFPDEIFRNWVLSQEYGKDGVLTKKEIEKVEQIDVDSLGIQSLKGIEYFTALKFLSCENNQLTELNVSKNNNLSVLFCHQNKISGAAMDALVKSLPPKRAGRNIVDYKGVERYLEDYAINKWRKEGFRIINNSNEQNVMTKAQVAVAKKKGWIPRARRGLSWHEYAGCDAEKPKAKGIEIDEENFPDENFRGWILSQDYGSNGILTKKEIEKVSFIKIPNREIRSLKGIELFKELKILICHKNLLTSLDLSKNTQLELLSCDNNNLSALVVPHTATLKELRCQDNKLTTLDVSGCTALQSLWCNSNQLTSLVLSRNDALTEMIFSQNKIKGAAMDALTEGLPTVSGGKLYVVSTFYEENVMTVEQVNAAKAKGWTVLEH